ncbi:hypothetical protein V8C43DRAFT_329315 [Trichoderma afarasin]
MDCFNLCRRELRICKQGLKESLSRGNFNRLWIAATWRYAWREMQPLELPSYSALTNPSPHIIRDLCGFQKTFPPEIVKMIQSHSPSSAIWRFCSTLQLMEELDSSKRHEVITCSLSEVLRWSRGSVPEFVESQQTVGPYVCLVIDSRGIESIERISEDSANDAFHVSRHPRVFMVELAETTKTIQVKFLLDMSHLYIPESSEISIWSAPMPITNFLDVQSTQRKVQVDLPLSPLSPRFVIINLDPRYCTGLSFFINGGDIVHIHGHGKKGLSAFETYGNLYAVYECDLIWTYIPLTAEDKINEICVRRYNDIESACTIALKMKSGLSTIGTLPSNGQNFDEARYTMEEQHPLLIHNIISGDPISYIGLNTTPKTITGGVIRTERLPFVSTYFSSASLENVLDVFVFTDYSTKLCKGIMIEYSNGLKRAVGQCRLGLDSVQKYNRPLKLSYAAAKYQSLCEKRCGTCKSVYVSFDLKNDLHLRDEELSWKHYEMKGKLSFLFEKHDTMLHVSQD